MILIRRVLQSYLSLVGAAAVISFHDDIFTQVEHVQQCLIGQWREVHKPFAGIEQKCRTRRRRFLREFWIEQVNILAWNLSLCRNRKYFGGWYGDRKFLGQRALVQATFEGQFSIHQKAHLNSINLLGIRPLMRGKRVTV